MRRRFIADEVAGNHATLLGEHADHVSRVLRSRVGQEFDIVAGDAVRRGRITSLTSDRVEFELGEEIIAAGQIDIILVLSVFKFDRMEWAIEKCTELGVSRIVPLIARRTDAHLAAAAVNRAERWQRIVLQAAEQSRRSSPPRIDSPMKLPEAVGLKAALRIVLSESEEQTFLRDIVKPTAANALVAVGPEGGWTADELQSFQQAGWISASLGNTILRAETAAIAATAVVASLMTSL